MSTHSSYRLRRLVASDAESYRSLRLESLHAHPEAFCASWEDEAAKPLSWFAQRLESAFVLGGLDEDETLLGMASLLVPENFKIRHKGTLVGMYVCPDARGTGLAMMLLDGIIHHAKTVVEEVHLKVITSNKAAVGLYAHAGFHEYGLEPRSIKISGRYYDGLLMSLRVF